MRSISCFLVVDLAGQVRVVKNPPWTHPTEIVVRVNLTVPTPPRVAAVLDIELPEPPEANVTAAVEEWGPVEDQADDEAERADG